MCTPRFLACDDQLINAKYSLGEFFRMADVALIIANSVAKRKCACLSYQSMDQITVQLPETHMHNYITAGPNATRMRQGMREPATTILRGALTYDNVMSFLPMAGLDFFPHAGLLPLPLNIPQ